MARTLIIALMLAVGIGESSAREECYTSGGRTVCRDFRPDGSAGPGYERRRETPTTSTDTTTKRQIYTPPAHLDKIPLDKIQK
jgi:hypothetical protein